ncbi:hypothetical protein BH24ACT4_BH24ACT4_17000 [soil metagenome]
MTDVSIRDLRNRGGEIVDRAAAGEGITITRNGVPIAELRPLAPPKKTTAELIESWKQLPPMDPVALRRDVDSVLDPSLW